MEQRGQRSEFGLSAVEQVVLHSDGARHEGDRAEECATVGGLTWRQGHLEQGGTGIQGGGHGVDVFQGIQALAHLLDGGTVDGVDLQSEDAPARPQAPAHHLHHVHALVTEHVEHLQRHTELVAGLQNEELVQ